MALINVTLQGKGGVGKSFVASLLTQYYAGQAKSLSCFDTDPVNRTFAGYKSFGVETVQLGDRPDEINPRRFDNLVERILSAEEDSVVVIDNGASTFLPLIGYMVECRALETIAEAGHEVRLHTVVTGGHALKDTLQGLHQVLGYLPTMPVVVWLNEYFGRIENRTEKGVQNFEDSQLYRQNKGRIPAVVRLPEVRKETFGHDIEQMMRSHLTFDEAIAHEDFNVMARQRLKMTWAGLRAAIQGAGL